ncbi:MAG: FprA family A-type flavoprotein [Candidatus Hodarchaeales archaeon]
MPAIKLNEKIFWIGVNDRTTDLFEGLWPINDVGVSYNSYIIRGEKIALIDLAKGIKTDDYLSQVEEVVEPSKIDYIIINHVEPDHTGLIKIMAKLAPNAIFVGTEKAKNMIADFYQLEDTKNIKWKVVTNGDEINLGSHHQLVFYEAPFVHWPETMVTYEKNSKILFSCDAFGSYGALSGKIFDDDKGVDQNFYCEEALRYYTNIVAKFSRFVIKAINSLEGLEISMIAPSHGLVWRKNPERIVELYKRWAEYAEDPTGGETGITLVYASMYGNTNKMMNAIAQGIGKTGIPLKIFDAARTHVSYILPYLWRYKGIIIGSPTYEVNLFPPMAYVLDMAVRKRIVRKKAVFFGSYGWNDGAKRDFEKIAEKLKWSTLETFDFIGGPSEEDLKKGEELGERIAKLIMSSD